ncbi:MAG TPA: hypothetical protein VGC27_08915 [Rhizomicrobium sp.]
MFSVVPSVSTPVKNNTCRQLDAAGAEQIAPAHDMVAKSAARFFSKTLRCAPQSMRAMPVGVKIEFEVKRPAPVQRSIAGEHVFVHRVPVRPFYYRRRE